MTQRTNAANNDKSKEIYIKFKNTTNDYFREFFASIGLLEFLTMVSGILIRVVGKELASKCS